MMKLKALAQQLLGAAVVLYSLGVMASVTPMFDRVPDATLLPFYLFVPGYAFSSLFAEPQTEVGVLFHSVVWSLILVAAVGSLERVALGAVGIPIALVVPVLTLVFFAWGYLHRKR